MPAGATASSRRLSHVSSALMAATLPTKLLVPNLPADFVARLHGVASEAGQPLELLVAETADDAVRILQATPDVVGLIDAVEMGATAGGKPTRWACNAAVLGAAPSTMRWVQSGQAGQDTAPLAQYAERGIALTNAAVITGSHLAEHILAFMLAFSRQL